MAHPSLRPRTACLIDVGNRAISQMLSSMLNTSLSTQLCQILSVLKLLFPYDQSGSISIISHDSRLWASNFVVKRRLWPTNSELRITARLLMGYLTARICHFNRYNLSKNLQLDSVHFEMKGMQLFDGIVTCSGFETSRLLASRAPRSRSHVQGRKVTIPIQAKPSIDGVFEFGELLLVSFRASKHTFGYGVPSKCSRLSTTLS